MTNPVLVFAWGNPGRGDDALGPRFAERIAALALPGVDCLTDFQLQVEHALDLRDRRQVLFVDAALGCDAPFRVEEIVPARDTSFTSHAMTPQALLQACRDIDIAVPHCVLLRIRGEAFELGAPLSAAAQQCLEDALQWAAGWLARHVNNQSTARTE